MDILIDFVLTLGAPVLIVIVIAKIGMLFDDKVW